MELSKLFLPVKTSPILFAKSFKPCFAFTNSSGSNSLAQTLQAETLETLEWSSICKQLSVFTSTSMGFDVAKNAELPLGRTQKESQKLLDQTTAARLITQPLDFSEIEDLTEILNFAASDQLLTIRELCRVQGH
ncbi:hypothetical protein L6164_036655 [Bauhinia variegata]|uniref:Uncharacterized protein n=1 Tax=Bauhinia variegata TaxID=167791 RepID=A0ACB9KHQ7_BAUVA|nr:hypothetical protein L6164_036655 [Bauhinia variegata]